MARIEPDTEGKLRCRAALSDLQGGRLEQVFMLGGLHVYGRPVAVDYVRRVADPVQVDLLPGGIETGSDLRTAFRELDRRGDGQAVRIYSTGYHLPRALLS